MADVTIYGTIDQAYQSTKVTDPGSLLSTDGSYKNTNITGTNNGGSAIGFKGSEDLGGGLKAFFQQEIGLNTDSNGGPQTAAGGQSAGDYENRNSFVGLSGGFGSIQVGRQYNFAFYNIIANDPMGFSGLGTYAAAAAGNAARTDKMIAYTLPTFVPGVKVELGKAYGNATVTTASPRKEGDSTSWALAYSNGALYAGFTGESVIDATSKVKYSSGTVTYDLGMVKIGYGTSKSTDPNATLAEASSKPIYTGGGGDYAPTSYKGEMTSITVPINGSLSAFYSTGSLSQDDGTGALKTKASQLGANYSLSKRTTVYLQTGKTKTDLPSPYAANSMSTSGYALGVLHSF